jgi:hypothetical protein
MTIEDGGQVGIGTLAPDHTLDVVGNAEISSLAGSGNRVVQADASGTLIVSNNLPAGDGSYIWNGTSTQSANFRISGIGYANASFRSPIFYDLDNTTYYWNGSSSASMRVEGDIRVGYGSNADNDYIYFDQDAEYLRWENGNTWFYFSDDITAPRLFDANNTGYYWDGSGTTRSNITYHYGNVYIGANSGTNNDLYLSDRIYDWDNTGYFMDFAGGSRVNEIQFDDGSATDPSVFFAGDANTGFYQPANNQLSITANGTEAMRVEDDGDVRMMGDNVMKMRQNFAASYDNSPASYDDNGGAIWWNAANATNWIYYENGDALDISTSFNYELNGGSGGDDFAYRIFIDGTNGCGDYTTDYHYIQDSETFRNDYMSYAGEWWGTLGCTGQVRFWLQIYTGWTDDRQYVDNTTVKARNWGQ